jgi:peptide/nickel transport system substrate-binding protein
MKRKRTAIAVATLLTVGTLVLAGCAPTKSGTGGPTADPNALPLTGWKSASYGDVTQGGTLNLAVLSAPTDLGSWNTNTAEGNEDDVLQIVAPTTGGLIRIKDDGSWAADPNYASSVKLISDSPQVVEVTLNDKAVWEDGTSITAADYKATFSALSGKDPKFDIASSAGYDKVSAFDVVSDYDFKVTFGDTYADWPAIFGAPVPAAIASDSKKWKDDFVTKPLPSIGPYVISKVDNSAKIYVETPNPKWWGQAPKLDKITFAVIEQEAQAQAFVNKELNAVEAQTADAYIAAKKKSGAVTLRSGGLTWSQVTFNGTVAPLNDVSVRIAIAHAINRELIGKAANEPLGSPAAVDGNWIFMPGQAGYEDVAGSKLAYDPAKAKSTLKSDGWTNAGGKWTKDGAELKLSIIVPQGTASNELRAQQIQASLKAIDVAVTIEEVPGGDYFTNIIDGKFQMATFGWGGTAFPISAGEALFSPAQKPGDQSGQNYSFITDEKLADLWASANKELDTAKRLEIAKSINAEIATYVPMVPIYGYPNVTIADKGLVNYGPALFAPIDWTVVGYTK